MSGDEGSAVPADSSGPGQTEVPRNDKDKPYKQPSPEPLDFRGPGREEPEPDVDEVVLGWFGPGDPDHPDFGDFWRGATLALEQENAAGGYRGKPFRLLPAWSESPWKAGIVDLTRLVYDRGAWAVIGGVDGTTTHLAVQIALKSHFLLLSPGSTDASGRPRQRAVALLAAALRRAHRPGAGRRDRDGPRPGAPFAVVASTDHDSHAALVALRRALGERRLTPASLVELAPLEADLPRARRPAAARRPAGRRRPGAVPPRGPPGRGPPRGGLPRDDRRRSAGRSRRLPPRGGRRGRGRDRARSCVEPGRDVGGVRAARTRSDGASHPTRRRAHGYDAVRLVAAARAATPASTARSSATPCARSRRGPAHRAP